MPEQGTSCFMHQRGYTLIEVAIVAAIVATMLAAMCAFALSQHGRSLRASVQAFDGLLNHAQAVAATSGNGATIVVAERASGGTTLYLYAGRPNNPQAMQPQGASIDIDATVSEATLGSPAFSLFLNSAGHVSGLSGYPDLTSGAPSFSAIPSEPPCPASGGLTVTLTVAQASDRRTFSCPVASQASPDAVASPPPPP